MKRSLVVAAAVLLSALLCSGQTLKTITECRTSRDAWMASADDDVKRLPVKELLHRTDELMACAKQTDVKPIESGMTEEEARKALTAHAGYATLALAYSQETFSRAAGFIDSKNLNHEFVTADEGKIHRGAPVQSQERKTTMNQQGRILGIGGIFFKSANQQQMKEWYGKHLGLADSGHGVMLPWREKDNPESEQLTVWSIFPGTTKYFEPSSASFMLNYIVDDLDALLDRLAKEGVRIDPKRQDESYGRFAWIYDPDGNKIELWQPLNSSK